MRENTMKERRCRIISRTNVSYSNLSMSIISDLRCFLFALANRKVCTSSSINGFLWQYTIRKELASEAEITPKDLAYDP